MRLAASLPPNRWDEFILTTCYLWNRVHTTALDTDIVPYEVYYGVKPNLSHLREIGCRAFVLILNKHNPKIYARPEECVLIGYGAASKTYHIYHRTSHRVLESYHVKFIGSKDAEAESYRPGQLVGLDDEEDTTTPPTPPNAPDPVRSKGRGGGAEIVVTPPSVPTTDQRNSSLLDMMMDERHPVIAPDLTVVAPPAVALRRSSRIPVPTEKLADAQGISRINAVLRATAESKAACDRLCESQDQAWGCSSTRQEMVPLHSRTSSARPEALDSHIPAPTHTTSHVPAMNEEEIANFLATLPSDLRACLLDNSPLGPDYFDLDDEIDPEDPQTFQEAMGRADCAEWVKSIEDELESFRELGVYKLVKRDVALVQKRKVLRGRFVFHVKRDDEGKVD